MPEYKEYEQHLTYPGTYVVLDGPGSTGKTSIQHSLEETLRYLIPDIHDEFNIHRISEPPVWEQFKRVGILDPYTQVTSGALSDPLVALPALAAYRRMMWNGATLDGEELNPNYLKLLQDSRTILLASRSPLSLVYQGVYPKSPLLEILDPLTIGELFWTYYNWDIPFPDLLYILIPEPNQQRERLKKRIAEANGEVKDWGDAIEKQQEVVRGFIEISKVIQDWPGVYIIRSEEVVPFPSISLSTILGFHLLCTMMEKGGLEKVIRIASWGSAFGPFLEHFYRVNTIQGISAYMIPDCLRNLRYFNYNYPKGSELSVYGDIGAFTWKNNLIIIAIEASSAINWEFAVDQIKGSLEKQNVVVLDENTRYGWRYLYSRHGKKRAWKNIIWE